MNQDHSVTLEYYPNPTTPLAHCQFISFDGGIRLDGFLECPDRYRFWRTGAVTRPLIPRGAGLSYAAASFSANGLSIEHSSFNRILDFDSEQHVVEVEAGIELSALHDFLSSHGLYLPIQPGHGRITVGGCIAADVHGKNHVRDGSFMNQVLEFTLFHPEHGLIIVSNETEPLLFRLTCGGFGLTGHILRAKLQASQIPSGTIEVDAINVVDLGNAVENLANKALDVDFAYTWHDFSLKGSRFGSGYLFLARFIPENKKVDLYNVTRTPVPPILSAKVRAGWRLPLVNRWTIRALNQIYRGNQKLKGRIRKISLHEALFPIHETQFYFKLFGSLGFHEYQVILPIDRIPEYINAVHDFLSRKPLAITLASAKLFRGQPELLRFNGEGVCLALNLPRTSEAASFLTFLDQLVISLGGIPNIIKDSRLPRSVVEACYPGIDRFRRELRSFDSKRLFRSELSDRLGL